MDRRRVVVTGLGVVASNGVGVDAFWRANAEGRSGLAPIDAFDPQDLPARIAGQVRGFAPADFFPAELASRTDRFVHFGLATAAMAFAQSGLDPARDRPNLTIAGAALVDQNVIFVNDGNLIVDRATATFGNLFNLHLASNELTGGFWQVSGGGELKTPAGSVDGVRPGSNTFNANWQPVVPPGQLIVELFVSKTTCPAVMTPAVSLPAIRLVVTEPFGFSSTIKGESSRPA